MEGGAQKSSAVCPSPYIRQHLRPRQPRTYIYIYIYIYIYMYIHIHTHTRVRLRTGFADTPIIFHGFWVFITGGCSGRGVRWMGVVLCHDLVSNIV